MTGKQIKIISCNEKINENTKYKKITKYLT